MPASKPSAKAISVTNENRCLPKREGTAEEAIVVDTLGTFTIRLELSDGKGKKLYSAKFLCEVP